MEGPTILPTHSQPILAPREIEAAATDGSRWCPFPFPVQRVSFARLSAQEEVPGERLKAGSGSNSTPSSHPPLAYGCTYGFGVAVSPLIGLRAVDEFGKSADLVLLIVLPLIGFHCSVSRLILTVADLSVGRCAAPDWSGCWCCCWWGS